MLITVLFYFYYYKRVKNTYDTSIENADEANDWSNDMQVVTRDCNQLKHCIHWKSPIVYLPEFKPFLFFSPEVGCPLKGYGLFSSNLSTFLSIPIKLSVQSVLSFIIKLPVLVLLPKNNS